MPDAILPDTCPPVLSTFGVSATFTLALTCPAFTPQDLGAFFHAQELVISVPAGKLLRVSVMAAGYKAHIEFKLGVSPVAIASAVDTGGTAIATYLPTSPQTISIFLSATDANATGAMTVTIDPVSALRDEASTKSRRVVGMKSSMEALGRRSDDLVSTKYRIRNGLDRIPSESAVAGH